MWFLRSLWQDESGQEAVEYALIVGLIVMAILGLLVQNNMKNPNAINQAASAQS